MRTMLYYTTLTCSKHKTMSTYITPKLSRLVYTNKDKELSSVCVSLECGYRDYPDKDYGSLVTALVFVRDASIFHRFLPFCIFRRYQAGIGTEHLKK
jgi:hypothetical protein